MTDEMFFEYASVVLAIMIVLFVIVNAQDVRKRRKPFEELEKVLQGIYNYINYELALPLTLQREGAIEILKTIRDQSGAGQGNMGSSYLAKWADIDVNLMIEIAKIRFEEMEGLSDE